MQANIFSTIEDVFTHLETEGYKYKCNYDIANLFIQFQNIDGLENISCFEIIVFKHLCIKDDNSIWFDNSNKYADIGINEFTENFYNRLKERVAESKHSFLKAYYAHLLWKLPNTMENREKNKYAQIAVNSYLELVEVYKSDLSIGNVDFKIYHTTRNACMIAIETGHSKEMAIEKVLENVTFLHQQKSIWLKALLLYVLQDRNKNFIKLATINPQEICFNSANTFLATNPFKTIEFFRLGEKIDQKLNRQNAHTYNWLWEIAKVYEKMSIERQDLANSVFCLQALNIYSSLKMKDKIQETAKRYKHLIASRQLFETHQVIDVSSQIESFKTMTTELLAKDIKEILQSLSSSDSTMVSIAEIDSLASNQENDKNNFLSQLSKSVLDNNGHIAQEFEGGSEKYEKLKFYSILLDLYYNSFVDSLYNELINKKILTFEILIDFLEQQTWLGQEIPKSLNGFSYEYRWLDFIKPALKNYFEEVNKSLENTDYQPNFILFIDSLASKMEGIIRDIFELNGGITFGTKGQVKNKTVEKDLNKLFEELEEKNMPNLIKTNDLTFFKFLLTDRGVGFNLRNDIAHTLMRYEDYNIKVANLLLLALLRLSHYQPTNQNPNATI